MPSLMKVIVEKPAPGQSRRGPFEVTEMVEHSETHTEVEGDCYPCADLQEVLDTIKRIFFEAEHTKPSAEILEERLRKRAEVL